jgi:hypothetical protein
VVGDFERVERDLRNRPRRRHDERPPGGSFDCESRPNERRLARLNPGRKLERSRPNRTALVDHDEPAEAA